MSEIRIIGPDGQRFVFPAGTDPEVMKSAMRRRYTGETRRTTEMIRNTQLPDERMQGARDYLARDQLRQDMEAGRQARRTEEATGPENVAQERFYTGAQGRTLGAAPLIQGAINIPISAMMYPFLTQEQKAGRSFDEFVSDMSSAGYDQARGSIDRAREKRPLESLGLEIAGGFIAGKTAYDDLGNRFLASQPGARGALVGAGSGAQYEFLESEGDPLAAGRGALIGAPVGAGVSKAMQAAAEPLGRLFRGEVPMPKLGPDATGAAYGAGLGGIAPADSAEERAQNMVVGAGIGLAPGVINRVRGAGAPRAMPDTMPAGAGDNPYFGRQSMRPPSSGPSPREIETQQQWATATPIVTQARTTAQSAQQAADAALQSKAPADIARAKDQKKALVSQLQEAQASRAGMDTPEDARLAETLASLSENTSDPVLLSTQISAAKTSLDRLLTDIGSPVEGNLIPVRTNILTRTQAPRSAAEGPQDRASVTRYAEGSDDVQPMGFGAGTPKTPQQAVRFETPGSPEYEAAVAKGLDMSQAGRMGRAKEMGFDTETVLYHGTDADIKQFSPGRGYGGGSKGIWFSDNPKVAGEYSGDSGNIVPVFTKRGKTVDLEDPRQAIPALRKIWDDGLKDDWADEFNYRAEMNGTDPFDEFAERVLSGDIWATGDNKMSFQNDVLDWLANDYDSVAVADSVGGIRNKSIVIFDPSNIRSVNAAFDPEKSGSSTLLAAAPFAAVGGVGAGAAMAGDAEAQTSNDLRPDGTLKGSGFLGPLPIRMPDGSSSVATEYSIGVEIDGRDLLIPTLVPTLTADQQRRMVEDIIPNNKKVPQDIVNTATQHALMRMRQGLSPFANNDED